MGTVDELKTYEAALTGYGSLVREATQYWLDHFEPGNLRPNENFNPITDLPHLLNSAMIVSVTQEPLDFRYRFIGPVLLRILGRNLCGRSVINQNFSTNPEKTIASYRACLSDFSPSLAQGQVRDHFGVSRNIDRVFLPIPSSEKVVSTILAVMQPQNDTSLSFLHSVVMSGEPA